MDILQEVTKSQTLIDELLLNLYQLQPGEENRLEEELPEEEFKKLSYVVGTYNKLLDDDEYSLSEKGLVTFRTESQALLHYLRYEYKALQQTHTLAKEGNRLFNHKTHILTWQTPVTWPTVIFHSLALTIALIFCVLSIFLIYKVTDSNNLILISGFISFIFLFGAIPSQIEEKNRKSPSIKFTIVATSFLLWKSLFKILPYIGISVILAKFKPYWKDDILILLTIGLPIALVMTMTKCDKWLTTADKLEGESTPEEKAD